MWIGLDGIGNLSLAEGIEHLTVLIILLAHFKMGSHNNRKYTRHDEGDFDQEDSQVEDDDDDDDDDEGDFDQENSQVEDDDGRETLPVHSAACCNLFLTTHNIQSSQ